MKTTKRLGKFPVNALAIAVAIGASTPAFAINFDIGEIEGQFDSSMSVGASWAMSDADKAYIGKANGGTGFTTTGDDNRLNFKKGETFSKIFKGIHDLELKYKDFGAFVRGKYWYDFELKDESRRFKQISDSNRKEGAQSSGAQILDAFVYYNYSVADLPGTVRAGRQVVSWGESTFIANGINSINPVDAAAARRPGAEVKEALLPVNMLYASQSLSDRLAVEAFYQLEWDQTIAENCGTYFAGDVVADGCTEYPTTHLTHSGTIGLLNGVGVNVSEQGVMLPRGADRDARDDGQFGVALRWLGDGAEYGAYFMNYHSRTPVVGYQNANRADMTAAFDLYDAYGVPGQLALVGLGNYYLEYVEDIRLYGLSFATTLPTGTAWAGEVSYRPNMPLLINTTKNTGNLASIPLGTYLLSGKDRDLALTTAGLDNTGYGREEVTQVQSTLTHFFDQVMGASRFTLVGEVGYTHIGSLEKYKYGRDGAFGNNNTDAEAIARYGNDGFYTKNSWGYRVRGVLDYNNVFAGINLSPNFSWQHDVDGQSHTFNEGSKAISIGVDATYRNTYTASLAYTDFFGGDYNMMKDRDFLALSFGVNF